MVSAAVILRSRPRHRVGVVLAVFGLVWAADGLLESWSALAFAEDLPGVGGAVWFVARFGAFLLLGLPLLLVLYPTGTLMQGRWRIASLATVLAAASLPVMLLLAPDDVVFRDRPVPGVDTELVPLPLSEDVVVALLAGHPVLTLGRCSARWRSPVVRHRRADGLRADPAALAALGRDRACLLAVPALLVSVAAPSPAIAAGSRPSRSPRLARPSAWCAPTSATSTPWWPGRSPTPAVAGGGRRARPAPCSPPAPPLLGDRLDEREVTLVVLVLAVAVYGPLRAWLGAGVRRVLLGRRGDRYDVVSALAARLEETGTVDEQLPALAGAVARRSGCRYVRVEVLHPGRRHALGHARRSRPGEVQRDRHRLPGERIGRLVLPVDGLPLDAVAARPGPAGRPGPPGGDRGAQQPAGRRAAGEPRAAGARPRGGPPPDPPRPARRPRPGARRAWRCASTRRATRSTPTPSGARGCVAAGPHRGAATRSPTYAAWSTTCARRRSTTSGCRRRCEQQAERVRSALDGHA